MTKLRSMTVLSGGLACFAVACSTYATTLKPKAASSLHCEQSQITISETATLCQVVTGCGRSDVLQYEADKWNSFRERRQ